VRYLFIAWILLPWVGMTQGKPGTSDRNSLGMKMVSIPAGSFRMGDHTGDPDEAPVRDVRISRSYRLAATEVTNAQYEQFRSEHRLLRGMHHTSYRDDDPVVFVSWQDALDFCRWLSKKEGKVGTPERPLSDLGRVSYHSYWTRVILTYLKGAETSVSIKEISDATCVRTDDIIVILQELSLIRYYKGQHILALPAKVVEHHLGTCGSAGYPVDPAKLQWTPHLTLSK
jgi:hypothetical protein